MLFISYLLQQCYTFFQAFQAQRTQTTLMLKMLHVNILKFVLNFALFVKNAILYHVTYKPSQ